MTAILIQIAFRHINVICHLVNLLLLQNTKGCKRLLAAFSAALFNDGITIAKMLAWPFVASILVVRTNGNVVLVICGIVSKN
jgi:hypothetical protein